MIPFGNKIERKFVRRGDARLDSFNLFIVAAVHSSFHVLGGKINMVRRYQMLLLTICLLLITVSGAIVLGSFRSKALAEIPVFDERNSFTLEKDYKEPEMALLGVLKGDGLTNVKALEESTISNAEKDSSLLYVKSLENYFMIHKLSLEPLTEQRVLSLLEQLNHVMYLEQEYDFNKMTIDGKELALHICNELLHLFELSLTLNLQGNMALITDYEGTVIYTSEPIMEPEGIHMEVLMLTLAVLFILLIICILLAKKNQLFIKDGMYNGFEKQEYA